MTGKVVFISFICSLVAFGFGDGNYLEEGDNYVPEQLRNANRLHLLRRYVYGRGETGRNVDDESENWNGRWMPDRLGDPTPPPKIFPKTEEKAFLSDSLGTIHSVPMGSPSAKCDDAKTNLTVDWNRSPINYTCYDQRIAPDAETVPIKYCRHIPNSYVATHKCMYEEIEYDENVPLFGPHRPLWPVYGEYKFLPKQRWLHSLEHGAIVALYHPCANPLEIKHLKTIVTSCLWRHVITPYNLLDENRPLALVAWGCRLTMSYVNPDLVVKFIREHALEGPEKVARDGDFEDGLLYRAETVSDSEDSNLCPTIHV